MKRAFKTFAILGNLIIAGGFIYMFFTFQQNMDQWHKMDVLAIVMPLGMASTFLGVFGPSVVSGIDKKKIQKIGIESTGRIVSVNQTGTYVNSQPEVELTIAHEINGREVLGVARQVISLLDIPRITEGTQIRVKYLPDKPEKVSLSEAVRR